MFSEVPNQGSAAFKSNEFESLRISTTRWDPIPYHLTRQFSETITVHPDQSVRIAGDVAGKRDWYVDNFLLFELTTYAGTTRFVVGAVEPVTIEGRPVPHIGPTTLTIYADALELSDQFPTGEPVQVRVSAPDHGGIGGISDVYLIIE